MSFNTNKKQLLHALKTRNILHEERTKLSSKNKLAIGDMSVDELINIVEKCRGNEYLNSPHHFSNDIEVHLLKTTYQGIHWYIKWYFIQPNVVFISVHN